MDDNLLKSGMLFISSRSVGRSRAKMLLVLRDEEQALSEWIYVMTLDGDRPGATYWHLRLSLLDKSWLVLR